MLELPEEVKHIDQSIILKWIEDGYKKYLRMELKSISENSILKGQIGESHVSNALNLDTTDKNFCGDIRHDNILIEVKNYNCTVPYKEVQKFLRDLELTQKRGGLFISLNSRISKKDIFEFDLDNKCIFICSNKKDVIICAMSILDHHLNSLDYIDNISSNKIIKAINQLKELCSMEHYIKELEDLRQYNDRVLLKLSKKLILYQVNIHNLVYDIKVECTNLFNKSLDEFIEFIMSEYQGYHITKNIHYIKSLIQETVITFKHKKNNIIILDNNEEKYKLTFLKTKTKVSIIPEDLTCVDLSHAEFKAGWLIQDIEYIQR